MSHGFVKVGAISPQVTVANPVKNREAALRDIVNAYENGVQVIALPELFLSGYTCADLFHQDILLKECEASLLWLAQETKGLSCVIIIGLPVANAQNLYNCAAILQRGEVLGLIPKEYLPNYQEFYEKRWFVSGNQENKHEVVFAGHKIPFGKLLVQLEYDVVLGVEICEDLWVPVAPSAVMALSGANIIVNISASNEIVTKNDYRKLLISSQSAKCISAYVYASAGVGESTTDLVFSGACTVAENGIILAEGERFSQDGGHAFACVDVERLNAERRKNGSFGDNATFYRKDFTIISGGLSELSDAHIDREFDPHPFVPKEERTRDKRCREILSIQAAGLAKRLSHTGLSKTVIGISGGLDSTLALLVAVQTMKELKLPAQNIICVTMPGFGTTDITYRNAVELITAVGAQLREINIKAACIQHMKDIGHDETIHDITYENTQARERTQILMDLSNKEGAILVGTGDLSELAMGWCTYNGDHMSMYGVNASVPKTLVRYLVQNVMEQSDKRTSSVLKGVLDTPVSPELLPPDENGNISQKTEEKIGPYELHDFFLYYFLRFGTPPEKMKFLAQRAFALRYGEDEIEKWLKLFLHRFFQSQFKRSCMPDGPKVGSVSLSPRGDWRMPSDGDSMIWTENVFKK